MAHVPGTALLATVVTLLSISTTARGHAEARRYVATESVKHSSVEVDDVQDNFSIFNGKQR